MLFCSAPLSSFVSGAIQVPHCDRDCDSVTILTWPWKPQPMNKRVDQRVYVLSNYKLLTLEMSNQ